MILLRIVGLFKTVLIIIAVILIIRLITRIMNAKRTAGEQQSSEIRKAEEEKAKKESESNRGKVSITNKPHLDAEDVDFKEVE